MKTFKLKLQYGKEIIPFSVPVKNLSFVVEPQDFPSAKDERKEVIRTLRNPIGSLRLTKLVKPKSQVIIIADDLTRVTPCNLVVPLIIEELNSAGVEDQQIKILIALGTHRPMTEKEIKLRFGKDTVERIRILNHTPFNKGTHEYLGDLVSGIPLWVNKEFLAADIKIAVGNVIPHCFGGYSAGAKSVLPGVCGEETTGRVHLAGARITIDKLIGRVENPLRKDMEEAAGIVGLDMIVNTVLTREGKLAGVFAGDFVKAHREAVKMVNQIYVQEVSEPADIIVVSSHPADIEYYQAIKGVFASYRAVKKGGTIILLTPCPEGIAKTHPVIEKYAAFPSCDIDIKAEQDFAKDLCGVACAMVHAQQKEKAHLLIVSEGLTTEMCGYLGAEKHQTLEQALKTAFKNYGNDAKIGVITQSDVLAIVDKM